MATVEALQRRVQKLLNAYEVVKGKAEQYMRENCQLKRDLQRIEQERSEATSAMVPNEKLRKKLGRAEKDLEDCEKELKDAQFQACRNGARADHWKAKFESARKVLVDIKNSGALQRKCQSDEFPEFPPKPPSEASHSWSQWTAPIGVVVPPPEKVRRLQEAHQEQLNLREQQQQLEMQQQQLAQASFELQQQQAMMDALPPEEWEFGEDYDVLFYRAMEVIGDEEGVRS
eukprot:10052767-Alexandrium_andersonii.AAC.1